MICVLRTSKIRNPTRSLGKDLGGKNEIERTKNTSILNRGV